ncbi:MAG: MFS transporter, partial [Planctomycetota bacterium]
MTGTIRVSLWPAILTTFIVGLGFAALKFVLIGHIGLDYDADKPGALDPLPWDWLKQVTLEADHRGGLREAITQAISAILTLGLIVAFPLNGPLAGAWRCNRLFAVSCAVVAGACMMTLFSNPWLWAVVIGIAYGAACAARGKVIPLLSHATGQSNTKISGGINAALALGLLVGTLLGSWLSENPAMSPLDRHLILLGLSVTGMFTAMLIRVPEPPTVPMAAGVRDFFRATTVLFRHHWALLLGGGLAWGIVTALSLALYVHATETLDMSRLAASSLGLFGALGAIVGNLISHWGVRRRWVILAFLIQAAAMWAYPSIVVGYWSAATLIVIISTLFAAAANVLDARFLAN